ncbi:hypothetical protein ACIQU6_43720 [Streptomyces sp. NPDC090442]|uniref:hypothetical protein n=1 Tax=Streptomyces sp. NPDC090442 TaxID=3365962 RepID=UPI003822AD8A
MFADNTVSDAERERILALGAAHLATIYAAAGKAPVPADVMRIAFEEFSLLLDGTAARVALRELHRYQ